MLTVLSVWDIHRTKAKVRYLHLGKCVEIRHNRNDCLDFRLIFNNSKFSLSLSILCQCFRFLHQTIYKKHALSTFSLQFIACTLSRFTLDLVSPSPWHSLHMDCICCTIPGPICRTVTLMPRPLHPLQGRIAPAFPPALENDRQSTVKMNYIPSHPNIS